MRNSTNDEITRADVANLRKRFQLVEGDRKAYFETFEQTKRQNDDTIRELRAGNQEMRKSIATTKRDFSSRRGGRNQADDEIDAETKRVHHLRAEYDKLRHNTQKYRTDLDRMKDQLRELERQSQPIAAEESPLSRKIRMLENRLDKAMIKYNEAQSIRTTYTQIVKRLTEERVGFDNQLAAIERTLQAKQNDYQELLLLSGDAKHAKEVALQELEKVRKQYQERCHQRQVEIKDREFIVKQREQLNSRIKEREKQRQDLLLEASGDLNKEDEDKLKQALTLNKLQKEQSEAETTELKEKLDIFENAFRRIKDATGVSDINEVIQKISTQEGTKANLMQLSKDNQAKIERLQGEQTKLHAKVEELKYAGPSARSGARKVVDELEEQMIKSAKLLETSRQKYERLQRVLIDGQAGIEHLAMKIKHVDSENLRDGGSVVDVLYNCETKLAEMQTSIKTNTHGHNASAMDAASTLGEADLASTRPFNRRVNLPSEAHGGGGKFQDEEYADDVEEGATREQMKLAARDRISLHTNKGKKVRKKKKIVEEEPMRRRGKKGAKRPPQM